MGGDLSGQVVAGDRNVVTWNQVKPDNVDIARQLSELRAVLDELRAKVTAEGGVESETGLQKIDELEEAISADEPDLATVEHVDGWFRRKMPALATKVNTILLGPLVASVIAAGGAALVAEFTRRLGAP
ncbi:hypothetical protein [Spongiactinospora sp. TRM90649]|uniref:hypothetical protein n=1 Tax=Spongiactinospora sp. TRM90649 TaxID=3031114 RepID=UPI0023F67ABA|nr:hypothetical protein [Spongiactinospora sp. TRM90649]MDF5754346.1 hypothetical protein [Spongiactinospora sp. TRM90649]